MGLGLTRPRSEVSGRLEAMQSVLANHGARLLEGLGVVVHGDVEQVKVEILVLESLC